MLKGISSEVDANNNLCQKFTLTIINALKANGFKYIILDLNMSLNDVTPGKTLTRKLTQLMNTLYGNSAIELIATDRKIKLNDSGQEIFVAFKTKEAL